VDFIKSALRNCNGASLNPTIISIKIIDINTKRLITSYFISLTGVAETIATDAVNTTNNQCKVMTRSVMRCVRLNKANISKTELRTTCVHAGDIARIWAIILFVVKWITKQVPRAIFI
jgi:hypothetical protein